MLTPTTPKQPAVEPLAPVPVLDTAKAAAAQQEYWEQRKRLADSEVMTKIWGLPRWKLWSRPMDSARRAFRVSVTANSSSRRRACAQTRGGNNIPVSTRRRSTVFESVAAEIDLVDPGVEHTERWVLFQSGQFVHNMALDRVLPLGKRTHVFEILEVVTALFEFTARIADRKIFTNHIGIAVELSDVAGRQLAQDRDLDGWCQEHTISIDTIYTADELRAGRRTLALDVALRIFAAFGWENPPREELAAVQRQRFG